MPYRIFPVFKSSQIKVPGQAALVVQIIIGTDWSMNDYRPAS